MDDHTWWQRHSPAAIIRIWRLRHSEEYRNAMSGYWKGRVCRFCDRNFAESHLCDIDRRRHCNFTKGSRRGILGPR